jgi:threonine dehydratase
MKIVIEPAGATVLAAVMTRRVPIAAKRIGVIISGGNVDLETFAELVATDT